MNERAAAASTPPPSARRSTGHAPVETAINACAVGKITVAITNADGHVVESGCADRVATRGQRRLLRAMYRTCAHPDCSVVFTACQVHHVVHWEHGGPTTLPNLVPPCHVHHHLVHDGGWGLTIDQRRTLRWYRPDGTLDRTEALAPLLGAALARPDHERSGDQCAVDGRDAERGDRPRSAEAMAHRPSAACSIQQREPVNGRGMNPARPSYCCCPHTVHCRATGPTGATALQALQALTGT